MSSMYRHHTEYYLKGGDFYLLAENILFRIHSFFFLRESPHFRDIVNESGHSRLGFSEGSPIVLDDVKSEELAAFLWIFYNPQYSDYSTSVERLIMILKTSHRYGFPVIKALALRELEKKDSLPVIDRILLYKKNGIDIEYLVPWFAQLCSRNSFLTRDEYNLLGVEGSYIVSLVRERARGYHSCGLIHHTSCCEDLKKTIAELLKPNGDVYDCLGGWEPRGGVKTIRRRKFASSGRASVTVPVAVVEPDINPARQDADVLITCASPYLERKRECSLNRILTRVKASTRRRCCQC